MPDVRVATAKMLEKTIDPLEETLQQVTQDNFDAIFLIDLERAIASDQTRHSIMQSFNLRRTEWPLKIRLPVVLWIPEYLLALLGREAPDFLDWRSDTLCFSPPQISEQTTWPSSGLLPVFSKGPSREKRIADLRAWISQIEVAGESSPFIGTRAGWRFDLANNLRQSGQIADAEAEFQAAKEEYGRIGDDLGLANCLGSLAGIYMDRGELSAAERCLASAIKLHSKLGRKHELAMDHRLFAGVATRRGDLVEGRSHAQQALSIHGSIGPEAEVAADLRVIAWISKISGDPDRAESEYRQSISIDEKNGNGAGVADARIRLAELAIDSGDLAKAEDQIRRAISIHGMADLREAASADYGLLGTVLQLKGDKKGARQAFEQGIIEFDLDSSLNKAFHLRNLARLSVQEGNLDDARRSAEQALLADEKQKRFERVGEDLELLAKIAERGGHENQYRMYIQKSRHAYAKGSVFTMLAPGADSSAADDDKNLELALNDAFATTDSRSINAAFLFAVRRKDEKALSKLMTLLRSRVSDPTFDPTIVQNIALYLMKSREWKWAEETLDMANGLAEARGNATALTETYYFLNKCQIKAHQFIDLSAEEVERLRELAKSENLLTQMGAHVLLRDYVSAENAMQKAFSLNIGRPENIKDWPIMDLLIPHLTRPISSGE